MEFAIFVIGVLVGAAATWTVGAITSWWANRQLVRQFEESIAELLRRETALRTSIDYLQEQLAHSEKERLFLKDLHTRSFTQKTGDLPQ